MQITLGCPKLLVIYFLPHFPLLVRVSWENEHVTAG